MNKSINFSHILHDKKTSTVTLQFSSDHGISLCTVHVYINCIQYIYSCNICMYVVCMYVCMYVCTPCIRICLHIQKV